MKGQACVLLAILFVSQIHAIDQQQRNSNILRLALARIHEIQSKTNPNAVDYSSADVTKYIQHIPSDTLSQGLTRMAGQLHIDSSIATAINTATQFVTAHQDKFTAFLECAMFNMTGLSPCPMAPISNHLYSLISHQHGAKGGHGTRPSDSIETQHIGLWGSAISLMLWLGVSMLALDTLFRMGLPALIREIGGFSRSILTAVKERSETTDKEKWTTILGVFPTFDSYIKLNPGDSLETRRELMIQLCGTDKTEGSDEAEVMARCWRRKQLSNYAGGVGPNLENASHMLMPDFIIPLFALLILFSSFIGDSACKTALSPATTLCTAANNIQSVCLVQCLGTRTIGHAAFSTPALTQVSFCSFDGQYYGDAECNTVPFSECYSDRLVGIRLEFPLSTESYFRLGDAKAVCTEKSLCSGIVEEAPGRFRLYGGGLGEFFAMASASNGEAVYLKGGCVDNKRRFRANAERK